MRVLMSQTNDAVVKINDEQANYAKKISARMSQPLLRRKGLIELLGILCAVDYFKKYGFRVNTSRSLHGIAEVFEVFKISDIYINNHRIDIITQFRDERIRIPYIHKEFGCLPDYYVVVRLDERLKDAKIMGYFKPSEISFLKSSNDYTEVDEIYLKSTRALCLELKKPACPKQIFGKHLDCVSLFLRFIDGELPASSKKLFIQHLVTCPGCTKKLADVLDFNRTVNSIQNIEDLLETYSIDDLGEDEIMASFKKTSMLAQKSAAPAPPPQTKEIQQPPKEQKYQNIIDGIFDNASKIEPSKISAIIGGRKKKIIITAACILLFLLVSVFIAFKNSNSEISSISDVDDVYSQDSNYDSRMQSEFASSHTLPAEVYGTPNITDYSIASRTTGEPLVATINKISWEVPENIANKANYTRFLQLVGKNVKLNLQNDLLLSNDFAKNNVIKLSIRIASNGDVIGMKMLQSSGSVPIDNIIKKSVSETLLYMKPPSHGLISRPVDVTLVITL